MSGYWIGVYASIAVAVYALVVRAWWLYPLALIAGWAFHNGTIEGNFFTQGFAALGSLEKWLFGGIAGLLYYPIERLLRRHGSSVASGLERLQNSRRETSARRVELETARRAADRRRQQDAEQQETMRTAFHKNAEGRLRDAIANMRTAVRAIQPGTSNTKLMNAIDEQLTRLADDPEITAAMKSDRQVGEQVEWLIQAIESKGADDGIIVKMLRRTFAIADPAT